MGKLAVVGGGIILSACAAASAIGGSALVKAPIEQQCGRYGLKACPELVEGVISYLDGEEAAATRQLRQAASKNVPQDIQRFAQAISTVLPGDAAPELVAILTGEIGPEPHPEDGTAQTAGDDEPDADVGSTGQFRFGFRAPTRLERVQLSMAAPTDPMRLTTESTFPLRDADKAVCKVAGSDAVCVRLEPGPVVVTDAMTPLGCTTELVIGATNADGRIGWLAPTNSPGFHGGKFFVRSNQWVVVAARGVTLDDEGDDRCYVTWAAFKPRVWAPDM